MQITAQHGLDGTANIGGECSPLLKNTHIGNSTLCFSCILMYFSPIIYPNKMETYFNTCLILYKLIVFFFNAIKIIVLLS